MLTDQAIEVAKRLAHGEVFFAHREPRLSPIIRDQFRAVGLEITSDGRDDVRFFAHDLAEFRRSLAKIPNK